MERHRLPKHRSEFLIAVFCALQIESNAVEAILDEKWEYTLGKSTGDPNCYAIGRISGHDVVLVYLPGLGKASAASASASLLSSFSEVKLALVVGICGASPRDPTDTKKEIHLGDIVISTGIVQYDFGRQLPDEFVRKESLSDNLARPTKEIRPFLNKMQGLESCRKLHNDTHFHLQKIYKKRACNDFEQCNQRTKPTYGQIQPDPTKSQIHFGYVASGDLVMKSSYHRDKLVAKDKAIAIEMEGAGVWDNIPTVIIKGVADYADSRKDKVWQKYAGAVAAACTKAFLKQWTVGDRSAKPRATSCGTGTRTPGAET